MVEDGEELDVSHPYEAHQAVTGIHEDAFRIGGGSSAQASMVLKSTQQRASGSLRR